MRATGIVDKLLEADPDEMSPETLRGYLTGEYRPGYRHNTVNLNAEIWSDERLLRRAFSWLTRIGAAPKFGTVPIHYYQQDQCKALDAIRKAGRAKGVEPGWARFQKGTIQVFGNGKWVPVARVDRGDIVPV